MPRWAELCISAISLNAAKTEIERLRVHLDDGENLEQGVVWMRAEVEEAIHAGFTFTTVRLNTEDTDRLGQVVAVRAITGPELLDCLHHSETAGNLHTLPEF